MRRSILGLLGAIVVFGASTAFAVVESSCPSPCTKPPKESLFVHETGATITSGFGNCTVLAGTIAKGKKKTVLRVDASFRGTSVSTGNDCSVNMTVNGIGMNGAGGYYNTPAPCISVTGSFWLDIDAAEAANPGMFINQPLTITLDCRADVNTPYAATFSAQVIKKK
jgi:hypothetical protein